MLLITSSSNGSPDLTALLFPAADHLDFRIQLHAHQSCSSTLHAALPALLIPCGMGQRAHLQTCSVEEVMSTISVLQMLSEGFNRITWISGSRASARKLLDAMLSTGLCMPCTLT